MLKLGGKNNPKKRTSIRQKKKTALFLNKSILYISYTFYTLLKLKFFLELWLISYNGYKNFNEENLDQIDPKSGFALFLETLYKEKIYLHQKKWIT